MVNSSPRKWGFACCLVIVFMFASHAAASEQLYGGVGRGSSINAGGLLAIDQVTGAGQLVGSPNVSGGISGLVILPSGEVYASTIDGCCGFGSNTSTLVILDPGSGDVLRTFGPITFSTDDIAISDLALQPGTNTIFGVRTNSDGFGRGGEIYTIALSGVATFVGDPGTGTGGGLGFAPDGTLYLAGWDVGITRPFSLHTIDPSDGSILTSVSVAIDPNDPNNPEDPNFFDGIGVRPSDGTLFVTRGSSDFPEILTLDPTTGVSTLLGSTGVGNVSDLAFLVFTPIPAVSPWGLLILGTLLGTVAVFTMRR